MKKTILLMVTIIGGMFSQFSVVANGEIRYVKPGGTGIGLSWEEAAGDLQQMIDESENGDEIWIAAGRYTPAKLINTSVANSKTFFLKDGVSLFGGFAGTELSKEDRMKAEDGDPWDFIYETIFDGNDDIVDEWEREIAPGTTYRYTYHLENNQIPGTAGNCCHLLYNADVIINPTVIDGITFTGGAANQHKAKTYGGAIYALGNVSVAECKFIGNLSYFRNEPITDDINAYGGALYLNGAGSASVTDCYFYRNFANSSYTLGRGGGLYARNCEVRGCSFDECVAEDGGGGAYIVNGSIKECNFYDCYGSAGGGLLLDGSADHITASKCRGLNGGGIYVDDQGYLSRAMVYDCYADALEFGESLGGSGGGIFVMGSIAEGCVVYNNRAFNGGGVCVRGEAKVVNSTIQHNASRRTSPDAANASVWDGESMTGQYYYNCITDPDLDDDNFVKPTPFIGLSENDAMYEDLLEADWHLKADSPLVDTGTLTPGFEPVEDFDGNNRIEGEGIDPGAYETPDYSLITCREIGSGRLVSEAWYSDNGLRLNGVPTENGVYIKVEVYTDGTRKSIRVIMP